MPPRVTQDRQVSNQRRRLRRGNQEPADWSAVDAGRIRALIAAVAAQGGAVTFGYSRDGGAYSLTFLGDGDRYTEWLRPSDAVEELLEGIEAMWTGEVG